MSTADPHLTVVIPCFDEERRIALTLATLVPQLQGLGLAYEVVVVDDRSTDRTAAIVGEVAATDPRTRLIVTAQGKGKGAAVRTGVLAARGEAVLVVDADLAGDLASLPQMLQLLATADAVLGSRLLAGAIIEPRRTVGRRAAALVFRSVVRVLTPLRVSDPQCGHKLFRRTSVEGPATALVTEGYAYEIELLLRLRSAGAVVIDAPITWREGHDSKVRVGRDGLSMIRDVWRASRLVPRH